MALEKRGALPRDSSRYSVSEGTTVGLGDLAPHLSRYLQLSRRYCT